MQISKSILKIKVAFNLLILSSLLATLSVLALGFYTNSELYKNNQVRIANSKPTHKSIYSKKLKQMSMPNKKRKPIILIVRRNLTNNISCHFDTDNDALPDVEDMQPRPNSIFFHETSCVGSLNSRKACSIESAARAHPNRSIYVFFNSPISEEVLNETCLATLTQYTNIKFARLFSHQYAKGTGLETILAHGNQSVSHWSVHHTADMLRFVTMYKYGGIYLDSDIIVVKSLDALGTNWSVKESVYTTSIGAMAFGTEGVGRVLAFLIITDIANNYDPDSWDYNGSEALQRSLKEICLTSEVVRMNATTCHGFHLYDPITVYPIFYSDSNYYFKKYKHTPRQLIKQKHKIYAHHLWNKISMDYVVEKDSAFDNLAKKYCPAIREAYGDIFGV